MFMILETLMYHPLSRSLIIVIFYPPNHPSLNALPRPDTITWQFDVLFGCIVRATIKPEEDHERTKDVRWS